ncbi:7-dehydrocholesterol reductase [Cercospora beticola]|uniref:7-dehydrocholesterol reductase n=2 Tax=Cercospora beticola TaxID=122368 RepID=A0A2G5HDF4_CERBT|nr:7-dehydrocholesterol reductase [Cercospora beticola]PIA90293.1 7-dehydrocholesterol reductase [Cercospora beticola]CAK1367642.1 unnamed protein product [Cercospora beticola]
MKGAQASTMEKVLETIVPDTGKPVLWGAHSNKAKWESTVGVLTLIVGCPTLCIMNWVALEQFGGSLTKAIGAALDHGPVLYLLQNLPRPTKDAIMGYAAWLLFQAFLYGFLPGETCYGQKTPAGYQLHYRTNGLLAWTLTHALFIGGAWYGYIDPAIIARNWEGLLVACNIYGFVLAILAQVKGHLFPSHPEDRKFSGSWIYDFWAGVELNPRFGSYWDFKFFHNGRPGIVAWTLINLSWAAYQYQTVGYVTYSMIVLNILQAIYVVDFFCNESWYTRTIDISHDHFGFMLAWGDATFLPTFYTLQAQYMARYPTHLSEGQAIGILALGLLGYYIFRSANWQRDYVRSKKDEARIWGRPAEFIRCKYHTSDGKEHESLLLTSGWWGVARHSNYLADLIGCYAYCATCGFDNILPWSYLVFMSVLLVHRAKRDERRCRAKYGEKWDEYCRAVPYTMIPGIF